MQDKGIKTIIRVVEIKSEEDQEEVTRQRKWASAHFKRLNKRLQNTNPIEIEADFRDDICTYYTFDLLHPSEYDLWFNNLRKGVLL